jgi:methoxymalonate biosynthesis acyl carrier protein
VSETNGQSLGVLRTIFLEKLAITVETADTDLLETGLVDSVTLVELVLTLEERFGVSLPFEDLEIDDFRTLARIAALIERSTGGTRSSADRL